MALVLKDRVRESTITAGTGTLTLDGAVSGFQSFSVIGNGNTTYYAIVDVTTGAWEVGVGTYSTSGPTLTRDSVLESSNNGNLVNFTSNIKDVFCTYPAEQAVTLTDVQTLTNKTLGTGTAITAGTINNTSIGASTASSGAFTNLSYTGTLTGGTGVVNLGSGQFYKDASGRIGIGTATPMTDSGLVLHVNGSALIGNSDYNFGSIELNRRGTGDRSAFIDFHSSGTPGAVDFSSRIIRNPAANGSFQLENTGTGGITIFTNGLERFRVDGAGNVGIGTNTPGSFGKFEVLGTGYTASNVRSSDASGVSVVLAANAANEARLNVISNHPLNFYTNNIERMRIAAGGEVGIGGVGNAGYPLSINNSGLGTTSGNVKHALRLDTTTSNGDNLLFSKYRTSNGSDWTTAGWRIQQLVDVTFLGYMQFNGTGNETGISFGTGGHSTPLGVQERMRITNVGNVGIGTDSPSTLLYVRQGTASGASTTGTNQFTIENNGAVGVSLITPTANQATIRHSTALDQVSSSIVFDGAGRYMAFTTVNNTERMRILSNGAVVIGANAPVSGEQFRVAGYAFVGSSGIGYNDTAATFGRSSNLIGFTWTGPNLYGAVDNAVEMVIGTTSDHRLKANSEPLTGSMQAVMALRPITYNPVEFDGTVDTDKQELGLIAHEVQAIRPSVVTGEKDAVTEDGKPRYQSVNYAGLVPDLIACIQELKAELDTVKAELQTLKGN